MADYLANRDTPADVAKALAARLRWEMEHGVEGYTRATSTEVETSAAQSSVMDKPSISKSTAPKERQTTSSFVASSGIDTDAGDTLRSPTTDPSVALEALRAAIGECRRCGLHAGRNRLVFGEGDPHAKLVFVGEGPGHDEDMVGRPFVGAAGQLLDRIIQAMGLQRSSVYICNVVKCRPPSNRVPEPSERKICGAFLKRQLFVIGPQVVVTLGSTAANYLLDTDASVGSMRGRFHQVGDIRVMPTYHPAYLLRNPSAKRDVWADIQQVMKALGMGQGRQ